MKLLMLMDNLLPHTSANSTIAYRIANVLKERYGEEVLLLGRQTAPLSEVVETRLQSWYLTKDYRYREIISEDTPKVKKLGCLLCHPSLMLFRIQRMVEKRYLFQREYQKILRKIIRKHPDIDCIICFSCPHDTVYAASQVHGKIPLVSYQLDPWSTHCYFKDDLEAKKDETSALSQCAASFITKEMYLEYQQGVYRPPIDRLIPLEFPNLIPPKESVGVDLKKFGESKIHCAYIGNLYDSRIRGPEFLFALFRALETRGIVLHIVGNTEAQARQYLEELPSNVILHGKVSPEEAKAYMLSADILINMGNVIENQLPSKTIDYIACGKPILNLCKIPNCPTLPYIEKYPLGMTVMESEGITPDTTEKVAHFCETNKSRSISFEEVKELFYQCTPEYVGDLVHQALLDIVEKG